MADKAAKLPDLDMVGRQLVVMGAVKRTKHENEQQQSRQSCWKGDTVWDGMLCSVRRVSRHDLPLHYCQSVC